MSKYRWMTKSKLEVEIILPSLAPVFNQDLGYCFRGFPNKIVRNKSQMSEINKELWEIKGRHGQFSEKVLRKLSQMRQYWRKGHGPYWYSKTILTISRFSLSSC